MYMTMELVEDYKNIFRNLEHIKNVKENEKCNIYN